ncbi:MAG: hypothetical protein U1D06_02880 [Paracoccaceae bacterium]|nr:hypothetical protein [Paracoccaceae bacterium]
MAGPGLASDLVRQFLADLSALELRLAEGFARTDWHLLRTASHGLIALAGTAGANGLHLAAERLNHLAHSQDEPALSEMRDGLLGLLGALISFIASQMPQDSQTA